MKYTSLLFVISLFSPITAFGAEDPITVVCNVTETVTGRDGDAEPYTEIIKSKFTYVFKKEMMEVATLFRDYSQIPPKYNELDKNKRLFWIVIANTAKLTPTDTYTINRDGSSSRYFTMVSVDDETLSFTNEDSLEDKNGSLKNYSKMFIIINRLSGTINGQHLKLTKIKTMASSSETEISGNCKKGSQQF